MSSGNLNLDEFLQITSTIWQDYELHGPEQLDLQRYEAVERLALRLREETRQDSA